jgi:hypothetical protein
MEAENLADLLEMIGAKMGNEDENEGFSNNKGADALSLSELAVRYTHEAPFKRGDLITPRRGSNLKGAGYPCVVLDAFPAKWPESDNNGRPVDVNDMRIARVMNGKVLRYYAEAIDYERYTGPIAP